MIFSSQKSCTQTRVGSLALSLVLLAGASQGLSQTASPQPSPRVSPSDLLRLKDLPFPILSEETKAGTGVGYYQVGTGVAAPTVPLSLTTIDPTLQADIQTRLTGASLPVGGVMMVDVRTGEILAAVEGRYARTWSEASHTVSYGGFPAASIFKLVTAVTAAESLGLADKGSLKLNLPDGCGSTEAAIARERELSPKGPLALNAPVPQEVDMTEALGRSCNGYFDLLATERLSPKDLGVWAGRMGWGTGRLPADFALSMDKADESVLGAVGVAPGRSPVGQVAAGFGKVSLSLAHAAWLMGTVVSGGEPFYLRIYRSDDAVHPVSGDLGLSKKTASWLAPQLGATNERGTGINPFAANDRYLSLRHLVGGKTGTLAGFDGEGDVSWYVGFYPLENPKVVVAAMVVSGGGFRGKAKHLAAEALLLYQADVEHSVPKEKASVRGVGAEGKRGALPHRSLGGGAVIDVGDGGSMEAKQPSPSVGYGKEPR